MKNYKKYLGLMLPLALAFGMAACQDDFDSPNPDSFDEVATLKANTSILELKTMYWNDNSDLTDYVEEVGAYTPDMIAGLADAKGRQAGDHIVIKGRVASSDYTGNIYKTLILQDETAAITIGIDATSLYAKYPMGQEVLIDVTGLYIGKYRGLMQLGMAQDGGVNRMPLQFFMQHAQRNGSAYVTDADGSTRMQPVDTALVSIADVNSYIGSSETTRLWQSRLVRFNNVAFQGGGDLTYAEKETTAQRFIQDAYGNSIMVYNSGYSDFWSETLPAGNGDVVGILSYYQTSGWQVLLIDTEGCMNFGNPTLELGTRENPYTVQQAIGFENDNLNRRGWITGYIVGAVGIGVSESNPIDGNDKIEWGAPSSMKNTLVIAPSPDVKDFSQCLAFELPQGSLLREYANLVDHPENINRQMWVLGNTAKYLGSYGITGIVGTAEDFAIDGVELPGTIEGNGSQSAPYNVAQIRAMNPTSTTVAVESGIWVSGYIVGWGDTSTEFNITASNAQFTVPASINTNILVAASPTETNVANCIGIQLPSGTIRSALNLKDNPGNLGKAVKLKGDVMKYCGMPGVRNTSEYEIDGGTPDVPVPGDQLFAESFQSGMGQFFIHNVEMSSALTYVWTHDATYGYMKASAYVSGASHASNSWVVSPIFDLSAAQAPSFSFDHVVNKFPSLEVAKQQVSVSVSVDGADWQKVDVSGWTDNASWKPFANSGDIDLSAYVGKKIQIGFQYTSTDGTSGTWEVNNFVIKGSGSVNVIPTTSVPGGTGGGENPGPGPDQPVDPGKSNTADFNTFNGGEAKSSYGTYSTASGWTATNAAIQRGGDTDNNPVFKFLGESTTFAVCLNGNTSKIGTLTSPTLAGGLSKLSLNYGFAFADSKCKFTINIKQGGNIVQSKTVEGTLNKFEVYTMTWDVAVTGDFVIEIVNDCPSNAASNKDRVSIWNLTWNN